MLFVNWRSKGLLAFVAVFAPTLLVSCGPTRYAFFQPQQNTSYRLQLTTQNRVSSTDTLIKAATDSPLAENDPPEPVSTGILTSTGLTSGSAIAQSPVQSVRHRNPDSYHNQRFSRLFRSASATHVATDRRLVDRHSRSRKTYKPALLALGASVLSVSSLFVVGSTMLVWLLGIGLPLAATLLGVASLTTIKRNPDQYRGKGWAMASIIIGTGMLGLALIAVAALSVSETVSR